MNKALFSQETPISLFDPSMLGSGINQSIMWLRYNTLSGHMVCLKIDW